MEKSKVVAELVYISDAEFTKMINDGKLVIKFPAKVCKKIYDKFYGGYNGTPPMGQAPNAMILTLSKE